MWPMSMAPSPRCLRSGPDYRTGRRLPTTQALGGRRQAHCKRRFSSSTDKRRILELAAGRLWNRTRENTEKMSASISKSPFPAGAQESSIRSSKVGRHLRYAFLALMLPFCQSYAAIGVTCGGWLELKGTKTGFFHTEQLPNRWWLYACVQAWDEESAGRCAGELAEHAFDGFAIGGLVPRARDWDIRNLGHLH